MGRVEDVRKRSLTSSNSATYSTTGSTNGTRSTTPSVYSNTTEVNGTTSTVQPVESTAITTETISITSSSTDNNTTFSAAVTNSPNDTNLPAIIAPVVVIVVIILAVVLFVLWRKRRKNDTPKMTPVIGKPSNVQQTSHKTTKIKTKEGFEPPDPRPESTISSNELINKRTDLETDYRLKAVNLHSPREQAMYNNLSDISEYLKINEGYQADDEEEQQGIYQNSEIARQHENQDTDENDERIYQNV